MKKCNQIIIEDKEVVVQKEWLRGLIKYAEKTEENFNENNDKEPKYWLKFNIPSLLGYIDSAKSILNEED